MQEKKNCKINNYVLGGKYDTSYYSYSIFIQLKNEMLKVTYQCAQLNIMSG